MAKREFRKRPKTAADFAPDLSKTPKADPALVGEAYPHRPLWKFQRLDLEGPWGWSSIDKLGLETALEKLRSFESMTWREIEAKKGKHGPLNHLMPANRICKQAQARLRELKQEDTDTLYSLHLTGATRVWGFRTGHVFHMLWWDPEHSVYEVGLRNT